MISIQPGSQDTPLNGATPVVVVAAPAAGKTRTVVGLRLAQLDSLPVTAILYRDALEIARIVGLEPGGEPWIPVTLDKRLVLAPGQELSMALTGAHATVAPIAFAEYLEGTD